MAPVVATAFFPLINLPNFILVTILVSFILVIYPDRIGLVNVVPASTVGTYGTYGRPYGNYRIIAQSL